MKLQTQFTVPNKELKDLDYVKKVDLLEEAFNKECIDYPSQKDCLVCCNLKSKNRYFLKVNKFLLVFKNFSKGVSTMELRFLPINVFRETPKVTFFDAGIDNSNGSDVVIHSGEAISPPDDLKDEQYYVHKHQIDHNLVITGERTFVLINPSWDEPHHVIYLNFLQKNPLS